MKLPEVGDIIRVRDWPGTARKRYVVKHVDEDARAVHATLEFDTRRRVFPLDKVEVVRR